MNQSSLEWGFTKDSGFHEEAGMTLANLMAIHELKEGRNQRPVMMIQALKIGDGDLNHQFVKVIQDYLIASPIKTRDFGKDLKKLGSPLTKHLSDLFGKPIVYGGLRILPNAKAWADIKGKNAPLVNTGILKKGIKYDLKRRWE